MTPLSKFLQSREGSTGSRANNKDQVELTFVDEARLFLLRDRCPVCFGEVFAHRNPEGTPGHPNRVWYIACGSGHCDMKTEPMDSLKKCERSWKMMCKLIE